MVDPSRQSDDRALMARITKGDEEAFAELYDRLSRPLFSLAQQMLGDAAEAEDALQESCLQLWRRAPNYDPAKGTVFSWAVMMTRSKVIDRLRVRSRKARVVIGALEDFETTPELASESANAADISAKNDEAARVRSALGKLPSEHRRAIEMAFFSELTHVEIAEQSGEPLGTIKARIRRGLMQLRDVLK